ncbi:M16 family metallopeptidase [Pseudobacteriovorax antillogorgiicola]|uniref:Zinc protease n=1 Tax=Pseudobacteriovorax antillogorgiicola TaxID=1513793 RepID=A0A1Y6C858_9BACT|nr:pitrilysin family protein [Pseudobacteriovorax antillogorgiicola]TCS49391.1 zinc protease [Pseudobacteriovorax antillogorgiicola]SMF47181.1 zinc protease [Pseudobacteriovorax antillogorgiicola]
MSFLKAMIVLWSFCAAQSWANIHTHKFRNGLDLVIYPSSKVPLVTIVLAVKAGGFTETPETNGLTHLWEHMFFKGNQSLPNQEKFNQRVQELGIVFNGDTAAEKVRYYFTLPSSHLEEGLSFMYHAIASPLLEQKELERERQVVLDEYDRNASQTSFTINRLKKRVIYGSLHYLRDPLGERGIIEKASREQLLAMKDEVFVPKNAAILVSGHLDPQATIKAVEEIFKKWQNPKDWKPPSPPKFPEFPKDKPTIIDIHPQAKTPMVQYVFQGPRARIDVQDTYAADVLISLLNLRSGKFYQEFIDSGMTNYAALGYYTQAQAGELSLTCTASVKMFSKARDALIQAPTLWREKTFFTLKELNTVQRSLKLARLFEVNRPSEYIKSLGFWWAITGMEYYQDYLSKLTQVTLAEVRNFVDKYLYKKPFVTSILLSPKDAKTLKIEPNSQDLLKKLGGS